MSWSALERIADPAQAMTMEANLFRRTDRLACIVWTTDRCLVVPNSMTRRPGFVEAQRRLDQRGFPVVVRASGGGVVPQGPGILNVTVKVPIARHERSPTADYGWLCAPLCDLVGAYGLDARRGHVPASFCDGADNVVVADRKLAGTAQHRGTTSALLHMVLLVNPELSPALDAIRYLRRYLGDTTPLDDNAHVSLASLTEALSDPAFVARELKTRLRKQLARRTTRCKALA